MLPDWVMTYYTKRGAISQEVFRKNLKKYRGGFAETFTGFYRTVT